MTGVQTCALPISCEELSQLLYHAQVMMVAKGYTLADVYRYL